MNTVKKRAFYRLGMVAAAIDRTRDDLVLTTRDCVTQLGDDLEPKIREAFEAYCSAANGLRGIGLALASNEADIEAAQEANKQIASEKATSEQHTDATVGKPMHHSEYRSSPLERNPWQSNW